MYWMRELIIIARAGQGAITAAEVLAVALYQEGKYPLAFPHFGAERTGAPMNAFVRWDHRPVRLRNQIMVADYAIYFDPSLLGVFPLEKVIKPEGIAYVNSGKSARLNLEAHREVHYLPADKVAGEVNGKVEGVNILMLGFFGGLSNEVSYASLEAALHARFFGNALKRNLALLDKGYKGKPGSLEAVAK
ncbi:MAG: 2-oxoacid:acceptor oxidoreductase family protein [bacterium JZ-2024 1]